MPATGATSRVPVATLAENWMVLLERLKVDWIFTGTFRDAVTQNWLTKFGDDLRMISIADPTDAPE